MKNDLISILRRLFENSESTPLMCEFFIVILNQFAMDGSPFPLSSTVEQLHAKLINEIGFTLIQNIILLFVQRLSMDPMHSHIVELCFIYLLRLFGNHPAETIRQHATEVVPLLHFLYECLYKPCFLPVDENDETLTTGGFTQIQTQSNVLMDYVMTLFALLCYNSIQPVVSLILLAEHPSIIQAATVNQICQRLNSLHNMNVILFLHQFLYYCTLCDRTSVSTFLTRRLAP